MPLSINVGLSRKASHNYQSTGVSINVTAELDQSLLARPQELQGQIESLYQQAEQALSRGAQRLADTEQGSDSQVQSNSRRNGAAQVNRRNSPVSSMTASQRRCITSLCSRIGTEPQLEAQDIVGVDFDQLNIRDASELIDHLKRIAPAGGSGAGGNGSNGNGINSNGAHSNGAQSGGRAYGGAR